MQHIPAQTPYFCKVNNNLIKSTFTVSYFRSYCGSIMGPRRRSSSHLSK
jgi:hypothetical protein